MEGLESNMKQEKSNVLKWVLAVICVLVCVGILGIVLVTSKEKSDGASAGIVMADTEDWDIEMEKEDLGGAAEGILIPGYGAMSMETGKLELPISIGNPKENHCYFKVAVSLSDGRQLYETDYIEPGQGITGIPLEKTIEPGTYEVTLVYSCFSMDGEMTELNGAESSFELTVN